RKEEEEDRAREAGLVSLELAKMVERHGLVRDEAQAEVASMMDALIQPEMERDLAVANGIYLYGTVGTGKTLLLDCLHQVASQTTLTRRVHFHDFMIEVHQRLRTDDIKGVANTLASESKLLCFDEFQVTDIADAVILHELFKTLFQRKTTVVATSNRRPDQLYENGINRQVLFEPFIDLLTFQCLIVDINQVGGGGRQVTKDYRKIAHSDSSLVYPPVFLTPLGEETVARVDALFHKLSGVSAREAASFRVPVAMGRHLDIPQFANRVGRFSFDKLCKSNVGAIDFVSLADACSVVFLEDVPVLEGKLHNDTRRFITLIDVLYDRGVKLVISAATDLDALFSNVERDNAGGNPGAVAAEDVHVTDKGGSSGRLTTMLGKDFEWSATGRMGASLADFYAKDDVGFAVQRARSRLLEMQTEMFWKQ
ncbi:AFG1-like ATPase (Lactation elevated protein 1), partial [Durusdinium trenchii]